MSINPCLKSSLVDKLYKLENKKYKTKTQIKKKPSKLILKEIIETGKANEYQLCSENIEKLRKLCDANGIDYTKKKKKKPELLIELMEKYKNGTLKGYDITKKKSNIVKYIKQELFKYGIIPTKKIIDDFQLLINIYPNAPKEIVAELFMYQYDLEKLYTDQIMKILKMRSKKGQRYKKDLPNKKQDLINYCYLLGNNKCDKMKTKDIKDFIVKNELNCLLDNIQKYVIDLEYKKPFKQFNGAIKYTYWHKRYYSAYFNVNEIIYDYPKFFKKYKYLKKIAIYFITKYKSSLGLADDVYEYDNAKQLLKDLNNM